MYKVTLGSERVKGDSFLIEACVGALMYYLNRFGLLGDLLNIAGFLWDHLFCCMSEKMWHSAVLTTGLELSLELEHYL